MILDQLPSLTPHPHPWYAIRVKTQREKSIADVLRDKGYAGFLPVYTSTRRWSDRIQEVELPLFPGYLFCRFDFSNRLPILTTPGVVHIVGIGKLPQPVDDQEIAALQAIVTSGLLMQPWPFIKVGQRVVIQEGPLRDVPGILTEIKGNRKLIVSITLLQRSVLVAVDRAGIRPLAA